MNAIHVFLICLLATLLYGSMVGEEMKSLEEKLKKEEKVLKDCFEKVKKACDKNETAKGKVHHVCGLIVGDVPLWGSYACKPFNFYASGSYYVMIGDRLKRKEKE